MNNFKPKLITIGAITIIIIIVTLIFVLGRPKNKEVETIPLTITNTIPTEGSNNISVFDPIVVKFNQKVDPLTFSVTSEPGEKWSISQTEPNSIKINHQLYLKVATDYKLTIMQHTNPIGTLIFKTAHDQNDPRQLQNLQSELDRDYPLAKFTPYETNNYKVVYSSPLTLDISIKNSTSKEDAISQVQIWVKSHNIDPSTHKYTTL